MDLGLRGSTAVVCAGSKGIGLAFAHSLAQEGCNLILNSRNSNHLIKVCSEIEKTYRVRYVIPVAGDIQHFETPNQSFIETHQLIFDKAFENFSSIDILFTNCGGPRPCQFDALSDDEWLDGFNSLLMPLVRLSRMFAPSMIQNGYGRIINLGSSLMIEPTPGMILSSTIRASALVYTKALSRSLAPYGITVNSVSTGGVLTERLTSLIAKSASDNQVSFETQLESTASSIPLQRFASPQEFVQGILFLASRQSSYITGTCLSVDGGLLHSI